MGVPCARVHDLSSLAAEMRRALAGEGPHLIEVMM
jgi:thiamine pyrophosphate-dependent acetolactate synthase large subunit-like protein